jgi:uncharacterized lipoprotein YmbA
VRVEAVHIPAELDRIELVRETAHGEFEVNDRDQWMTPLGQGIREALTIDLAARLPPGRVIFPHLARPPGMIGLSVDLLDFEADRLGVEIHVSWLGATDGPPPRSLGGARVLQTSLSGPGSRSMASAMSALVAELADTIVEDLSAPAIDR